MTRRHCSFVLASITLALVLSAATAGAQQTDAASSASTATAPAPAAPAATSGASSAATPAATPAAPAAPAKGSSKVAAFTRIHRVDDFVTQEDLAKGVTRADKDTPIVSFSHNVHTQAGVSCEQCHHTGVQNYNPPECATCHKGAAAVETMHAACITCHRNRTIGPTTNCNECHTARQASFAGIVRFELEDWLRGPLFIAAWIIFALGFAWRIRQFVGMSRKTAAGQPIAVPRAVEADVPAGKIGPIVALLIARRWLRRTIFGKNPVMGVVSLVFHLALFLVPLLLPAHNVLFYQSLRVSLPTLPEPVMDYFTAGLLVIGAFFLLRRIFVPRVRALTTLRDYLVLLLVAAPFVTAYMAYHQWLDYRTVLVTHMFIGEVLIAAIPFTKLGHMPFSIYARFFEAWEYAWKPGNRRW